MGIGKANRHQPQRNLASSRTNLYANEAEHVANAARAMGDKCGELPLDPQG
jgi:hypothetical protein